MDEPGFGSSIVWNIFQMFQLMMWFFQFIIEIKFSWDYFPCWIFSLLIFIGHCIKLRIYLVPPDLFRWSYKGLEYLLRTFIMMWLIMSKKHISLSNSKQCYAPSDVRLLIFLMDFQFQPCEIFEGFVNPQEVESIALTNFASCAGLGNIINNFVS